jgi:hypothetical protein
MECVYKILLRIVNSKHLRAVTILYVHRKRRVPLRRKSQLARCWRRAAGRYRVAKTSIPLSATTT